MVAAVVAVVVATAAVAAAVAAMDASARAAVSAATIKGSHCTSKSRCFSAGREDTRASKDWCSLLTDTEAPIDVGSDQK